LALQDSIQHYTDDSGLTWSHTFGPKPSISTHFDSAVF